IELRLHSPDRGGTIAHDSPQQSRVRVEVQRPEKSTRAIALDDGVAAIADDAWQSYAPAGKDLLDLPGERHLRLKSLAVQLVSHQLVVLQQPARRLDPSLPAVERPYAVRSLWIVRES